MIVRKTFLCRKICQIVGYVDAFELDDYNLDFDIDIVMTHE